MARRGSIQGLRRLTLTRCSGEASTALRVTSVPVPAVVGIATNGADGCVSGLPRPMTSRYSSRSSEFANSAAIALPVSSTLPPPKPTTRSQRSCLASSRPSSTRRVVGSPATCRMVVATPCRASTASSGAARSADRPSTTSARLPSAVAAGPACSSVPGPKMMRVAVANSKRTGSLLSAQTTGRPVTAIPSPHRPGKRRRT